MSDEELVPMRARYRSKCERCEEWIEEDDEILWGPENLVAYHRGCEE